MSKNFTNFDTLLGYSVYMEVHSKIQIDIFDECD